jgi:hypothetical protein
MVLIKFNLTNVKRLASFDLVTFTTNRITNMQACTDFLPKPEPTAVGMTTLRDNYQTSEGNYKAVP